MRLYATIKAPASRAPELKAQLAALGVADVEERAVPYQVFAEESRLNYDCVFQEAWDEKRDVVYLDFSFEDSAQGREQTHFVEYHLKQIPLNLRYQ